ncbi:MAG: hypothetical protein LBS89_00775 [Zoogloeaceae bacterium]|jgi:hypothetical protein|nr:hypothetical protein [Zoogloeaceae bacterium]
MKRVIHYISPLDRRPGVNVGLRILLAVGGGYGLALLGAAALAAGLPLSSLPDAVTLAIMLAFIVYLLAVIWVFSTATLLRAALGLAIPAMIFWVWLQFAAQNVAQGVTL